MNAEQLYDMATHFRELACESRDLGAAVDLTKLAAEYESVARGLESSGESILATPLSLPGVRQFA